MKRVANGMGAMTCSRDRTALLTMLDATVDSPLVRDRAARIGQRYDEGMGACLDSLIGDDAREVSADDPRDDSVKLRREGRVDEGRLRLGRARR
jgi:hypothetical protein